jgi:hypothetical protein
MSVASIQISRDESGSFDMSALCATEEWRGDLGTGLLRIGLMTRQILRLEGGTEQGLLSLIQRFEPSDRGDLIDEFERAATAPTRFSFATRIVGGAAPGQTVFCIGRSSGHGAANGGCIEGIFIFPHM